ncbi:TetR/AcrR family transcriptional regulator [Streptomyces cavernicola]|uniref:Helix-turn-helix domain-containing protein n=1 Tax=Streptomyces cavernicola TaxID=3043613 RepID=A0ABT6S7J5_9ACTN|nr:helix-turn-helix domain-containing protein [Streptomyces sp. B-S-A6]MDI3404071.1 helix-turn-helix domain-containing protein [Streptomyces sp. B-S-A6]
MEKPTVETSTRLQILLAAERLFATQGIDATSLRQVSSEAHQRNTAAAKYHFQNKEALIRAIFEHRLDVIDARRGAMLKSAEAGERLGDPRELVDILVRPLAEQATSAGSYYVRFLHRVFEYVGRDVTGLPELGGLEAAVAVGRLVTDRLPGLAQPVLRPRIKWAGQLVISALADLEASQEAATTPELDPESYVMGLIDAVTGLLTAETTARPDGEP